MLDERTFCAARPTAGGKYIEGLRAGIRLHGGRVAAWRYGAGERRKA